jgi:amidophosphoribosyltransferase
MCGILCILNKTPLKLDYFIEQLSKLQHRGQNSFGFCYPINNKMEIINIRGLIKNYVSNNAPIYSNIFMGHTRYITSGTKDNNASLPIHCINKFGEFVFIFNGNIDLAKYNKQFSRSFEVDTLLIKEYLENCSECESFEKVLINFINTFDRAYSIIIYFENTIYCIRDRYGVRPLVYNISNENIIIASELDVENKNIECGEIVKIRDYKLESIYKLDNTNLGHCLFEYIYFMNKNTIWNNIKVEEIRCKFGEKIAKYELDYIIENKNNYIVVGIPTTGIPSARSYAMTLGIIYEQLITKNKNINRTFILNTDIERKEHARNKYIFSNELKEKNIILFDDSIVRGITMKLLVTNLKLFGVNEVHVRISSPQIKYECAYGIDIPTKEELLMNKYINSVEKAKEYLGCDSLKFIEIDEIKSIMDKKDKKDKKDNDNYYNYSNKLCTGCFNNDYKEISL